MHTSNRRAFLMTGVASAAALMCRGLAAQHVKVPRVVILVLGGGFELLDPIRTGLVGLGYEEGRNLILEIHSAQGDPRKVPDLLMHLAGLNVDVLVTVGAVGAAHARRLAIKLPIVFAAVIDPVAIGLAASLDRPGGNFTGITAFDSTQPRNQLQLLKEVIPNLSRVSILSDQAIVRPDGESAFERSYSGAAEALGLQPHVHRIKGPNPDLHGALSAMKSQGAEALVVMETPVTVFNQKEIANAAAAHKIPALYPGGFSAAGGLITYGTTILDTLPRIPNYVDKILKGSQPAELPIEVITRHELVFNLQAARAIGMTIPSELLKRADRVIE